MPQTNYLTLYAASYPILARVQKPGGVTIATTVGAGDVPNKPTFTAGTIQMLSVEEKAAAEENGVPHTQDAVEEAEMEEVEEEHPEPTPRGRRGRR